MIVPLIDPTAEDTVRDRSGRATPTRVRRVRRRVCAGLSAPRLACGPCRRPPPVLPAAPSAAGPPRSGSALRRVPGVGLGRRGAVTDGHAGCAPRPARSPAPRCRSPRCRWRRRRSAAAACPSSTGSSAADWSRAPRSCWPASPASARARCCSRSRPRPSRYQRRTLYVTGEESASQVRLRADRTGGVHDELYLAAETDLGAILTHVEQVRPEAAGGRLDPDHRRRGPRRASPAASPRSRRSRPR